MRFSCVTKAFYPLAGISSHFIAGVLRTYIHEWGHKAAAHLVLNNCTSQIEVKDWIFGGGNHHLNSECSYEDGLSFTGKLLGEKYSKAFVSAAGLSLDMTINVLMLYRAKKNIIEAPNFAIFMAMNASISFVSLLGYAILDLFYSCVQNGDFSHFSKHVNIPPNVLLTVSAFAVSYLSFKSVSTAAKAYFELYYPILPQKYY